MKSPGTLLACCALMLGLMLSSGSADATGTPTAAGTWSCCGAGGAGLQTWVIKSSGSRLSGGGYDGSSEFSPISGSVSGTTVTIITGPYITDPGYSATFVGKLSASGTTMSGTWTSNVHQSGTWTATRTAGSPTTQPSKKQEEEKKKEEEAKSKKKRAKLATSMTLRCDQYQPDTPLAYFECTAEVSNASITEPLPTPSGIVSFAVNPGGGGGFRGFDTCSLKPSELTGNSAFCSVTYWPPPEGIPIGAQPPITGSYLGDSTFAPSSAQPSAALPQVPQASAQQSGSSVPLKMTCPAQTVCTGTAQLAASGAQASAVHAGAAGSAIVATGSYSIAAHGQATIKLHLTARGRSLIKKHHRHLIVTLQITPKGGSATHKALVLK